MKRLLTALIIAVVSVPAFASYQITFDYGRMWVKTESFQRDKCPFDTLETKCIKFKPSNTNIHKTYYVPVDKITSIEEY